MPGKSRAASSPPQRLNNDAYFPPQSSPIHIYHQFASRPVDVHWHEFYEVHFILAGEGTHLLNGQEHPLKAGTLFLLTPTDFHAVIPQPDQPLELFNVIFKEELFSPAFLHLLFATPGDLMMQAVAPDLEYEFRRLWQESEQQQTGYQEVVRGALERILIDLRRGCSLLPASPGLPEESTLHVSLRPALIYLQHHFREPLSLTEVARQAGLSPHYFSTCFHAVTGLTFQSYLQDLRLCFARALLVASHMPITTICSSAGFNSLAHFERVFKLRFGMSPRSYQKQHSSEKWK